MTDECGCDCNRMRSSPSRFLPQGKSYAFVNFASDDDAVRARNALDGRPLHSITGERAVLVYVHGDAVCLCCSD